MGFFTRGPPQAGTHIRTTICPYCTNGKIFCKNHCHKGRVPCTERLCRDGNIGPDNLYINCPTCRGAGDLPCPSCNGQGTKTCPNCSKGWVTIVTKN